MKKGRLILILVISVLLLSTAVTSFAWFASYHNTLTPTVKGTLVTEYFHCGSGKQDDPFVITRPIHYYHMVEFFQRITNLPVVYNNDNIAVKFSEQYLYFQIGCTKDLLFHDAGYAGETGYYVFAYDNEGKSIKDENGKETASQTLNMAYYSGSNALMPLGTSEIPFNGQLDGKGITVANLNITTQSTVAVVNSSGTKDNIDRYTADVGVFGYVGTGADGKKNVIKDLYLSDLTIDITGLTPQKNRVRRGQCGT